ncbi:hypothetical protein CARN8_4640001 [mine drainage metagenome]|uniref:Uncharacterized protein n=1 Tax=mine drainage metagenome TaxID=410659 RepID=A0A3P3ZQ19_9ZZZZ
MPSALLPLTAKVRGPIYPEGDGIRLGLLPCTQD